MPQWHEIVDLFNMETSFFKVYSSQEQVPMFWEPCLLESNPPSREEGSNRELVWTCYVNTKGQGLTSLNVFKPYLVFPTQKLE